MRRRDPSERTDVRARLLAHYEALLEEGPAYRHRLYGPRVEQLRSGKPVVMQGWHLSPVYRPPGGPQPYADFCVETDGRVTRVEAVYAPDDPRSRVDYRRPDGSSVYGQAS